ncbi:MAG: zinc ribbon domain-containing protein [Clostridia bacterium]|nr:zinc ribbon domain-containing protein [Clostridia bacterium]
MFCTCCGKEISDKAVICIHCGVMPENSGQPLPQIRTADKPVEAEPRQPKKVNAFALSGFIIAIASIVLGMLSVYINHLWYTGVHFQFFFVIPLAASLVLSIIGTVKAKKTKSGLGFGIAGIVISGGTFVLTALYFILLTIIAYAAFGLFLFLLALFI